MNVLRANISGCIRLLLLSGLLLAVLGEPAQAQNSDLVLEVDIDDRITEAQRLDINRLGIDTRGRGESLIWLTLENTNMDQPITDLYFYIRVEVSGIGTIAEINQRAGEPFSLQPGQMVVTDNNQLSDGLPGVAERIRFEDAGLTSEGEQFINELEGFRLPRKRYTVTVGIYQGENRVHGGEELVKISKSFGDRALGGDDLSIYLTGPGEPIGTESYTRNTRPVFNWEGDMADSYRIIVVRDTGDDPESLIQNALSTDPVIGGYGFGDYLDFEMADAVITDRTNFPYPVTNVQSLEEGERYFWQVFTLISTADGEVNIPSEIFEFSIAERDEEIIAQMQDVVEPLLAELLSGDQLEELDSGGFNLQAMEINGQRVSGPELQQMLEELIQRKRQGEITIAD